MYEFQVKAFFEVILTTIFLNFNLMRQRAVNGLNIPAILTIIDQYFNYDLVIWEEHLLIQGAMNVNYIAGSEAQTTASCYLLF